MEAQPQWKFAAPLPKALGEICGTSIGGKIRVIGGALGLPDDALATTVERFSGILAAGSDMDFARPLTPAMLPLADGAFPAIARRPLSHATG